MWRCAVFCLVLVFLGPQALCSQEAKQRVSVALVTDGENRLGHRYLENIQEQLQALLAEEFSYSSREFVADWTMESVQASLDAAYRDPEVDIVVLLGSISSYVGFHRKEYPKPTIITLVFSEQLEQIASLRKGSQVPNLSYIQDLRHLAEELDAFANLDELKKLLVVADEAYIDPRSDFQFIRRNVDEMLAERQMKLTYAPVTDSIDSLKELLNEEQFDGVWVLPTSRMTPESFQEMVQLFKEKKLPSFSLLGEAQVEDGLLATVIPTSHLRQIGRRVALMVQEILLFRPPRAIDVSFTPSHELIVNETTARAIGLNPSWFVLSEGRLIQRFQPAQEQRINLLEAMDLALRCNQDLEVGRLLVEANCYEVKKAKSTLLPQLSSELEAVKIDDDRAISAAGSLPERSLRGSYLFTQMIWDEPLIAAHHIERKRQLSLSWDQQARCLDTLLRVSEAYFEVLRVRAAEGIARDNLEFSRANLKRARDRVESGEARLSEVYRWESEISKNQQELLDRQAELKIAKTELNRVLFRPLTCPIYLQDIEHNSEDYRLFSELLRKPLQEPFNAMAVKNFSLELARERAPELQSQCYRIEAQDRSVLSAQRTLYMPSIYGSIEQSKEMSRGGYGVSYTQIPRDRLDTTMAITLSYPLWTSGKRRAEICQSHVELERLRTEYCSLQQIVEQSVVNAVDLMKASFLGIEFANRTVDAAQKNLRIVADNYARGVISIIDLIDAQNNLVTARLAASDAAYRFLADLARYQRSIGGYDIFAGDEQVDQLKQAFQDWMEEHKDAEESDSWLEVCAP